MSEVFVWFLFDFLCSTFLSDQIIVQINMLYFLSDSVVQISIRFAEHSPKKGRKPKTRWEV
jgi:hypothetical protein